MILLFRIFKTLTVPNRKSWGASILRECSRPTMCYMSGVKKGSKELTSKKSQFCLEKNSECFGHRTIEPICIWKDFPKEMWVSISKGLILMNTAVPFNSFSTEQSMHIVKKNYLIVIKFETQVNADAVLILFQNHNNGCLVLIYFHLYLVDLTRNQSLQ